MLKLVALNGQPVNDAKAPRRPTGQRGLYTTDTLWRRMLDAGYMHYEQTRSMDYLAREGSDVLVGFPLDDHQGYVALLIEGKRHPRKIKLQDLDERTVESVCNGVMPV